MWHQLLLPLDTLIYSIVIYSSVIGLGGIGLAGNNLNSESGSTGRSAQDDGYGTESGSNQKVNTVRHLTLQTHYAQ